MPNKCTDKSCKNNACKNVGGDCACSSCKSGKGKADPASAKKDAFWNRMQKGR